MISLSLLITVSCASIDYKPRKKNNIASVEVLNRIHFINQQLKRYLNGKKANFNLVNDLVNLSGIEPSIKSGNWSGLSFIPNKKNILEWKKWHEEHKELFYFNPEHRIFEFYNFYLKEGKRKSIIFLKTKNGEQHSTLSYEDLITAYTMLYKHRGLKNSKKANDKVLVKIIELFLDENEEKKNVYAQQLFKLSKLDINNLHSGMRDYEFLKWFHKYENYIYYEGFNIAIKYPSTGERIVLDGNATN